MPGFFVWRRGRGTSPDCRVGRSLGGCVPAFRYIPFRAIAQAQAVVGREQRTAPADGQCVEDAQFAQRTPVVPGVGEEFRSRAASAVPPLALTTRALPSAARATYSLLESRAAGSYRSSKENRVLFRAVDGCRTVGSGFRVTHEPGRGEADRAGACRVSSKGIDLRPCASLRGIRPAREPVPAGA